MMRSSAHSSELDALQDDPDATARRWVLKLASGHATAADAADLRKWMALDPSHQAAFERARELWHDMDAVAPAFHRETPQSKATNRRVLALAAAIAAIMFAPFGLRMWAIASATYHSPAGEVTAVDLPDGSKVWLDSSTALDLQFTPERRAVELLKGRAFFVVAHDSDRPFVVATNGGTATAIGTQYSVAKTDIGAVVAVEEGRVQVAAGDSQALLSAGNESGWSKRELTAITSADVEMRNAWRRGRIVIQNETLAEAIAQLDRYHSGIIIVRDRQDVRINGQFDIHETDRALTALAQSQGLNVSHWGPWITVLTK